MLEGHTSIINGRYTALSKQEAADCTSSGTIARGGKHDRALTSVNITNHLASSSNHPFQYKDGHSCNAARRKPNALPFKITRVLRVRGDGGLATALNSGPVALGMGFDRKLYAYRGGVYRDRGCMSVQNHAVAAVGYTPSYWITRNSWGTGWGEEGHARFTRQYQNMCHVSSYSFYITVQRSGQELEKGIFKSIIYLNLLNSLLFESFRPYMSLSLINFHVIANVASP